MNYRQQTEGKRYQITLLYEDNVTPTELRKHLGVYKSTVSRNWASEGYEPNPWWLGGWPPSCHSQSIRAIFIWRKSFYKADNEVSNAIISLLNDNSDVCHSITLDNSGNSQSIGRWDVLRSFLRLLWARAEWEHKQASSPAYPEGGWPETLSEEDLQRYQGMLNSKPRKWLGFRQSSVVFAELRKAA